MTANHVIITQVCCIFVNCDSVPTVTEAWTECSDIYNLVIHGVIVYYYTRVSIFR